MNSNHLAIGVFDSGMGGLTVLRALKAKLPQESFIYLGDTARLPYGTKSPETVKEYAIQMTRILVERGVKAIVIACNTATTAALTHLQSLLPDLPVIGVVSPGAMAAVAATRNQKIAVLATETTIASGAYQELILKALPQATISVRACSLLVALAEEGMHDHEIAQATLKHYLADFNDEDTLVLACTHFPVFKKLLAQSIPNKVNIVDSAQATAEALQLCLTEKRLLQAPQTKAQATQYLVTDATSRFQKMGELFLGEALSRDRIELI